eukprot:3116798-Rhodomonas_salina.1
MFTEIPTMYSASSKSDSSSMSLFAQSSHSFAFKTSAALRKHFRFTASLPPTADHRLLGQSILSEVPAVRVSGDTVLWTSVSSRTWE